MKKPENFLQAVWDKLSEDEKKEVYLDDIIYSLTAPPYLAGLIEKAECSLDDKITIAEKILNGENLTESEKKLVNFDTID